MLSYDEAMAQQSDFRQLCQKVSAPGVEMFAGNEFYGHATVLKDYAGIPQNHPLNLIIQHGIQFGNLFWDAELNTHLRRAYVWQDNKAPKYLRAGFEVVNGTMPAYYALKNIQRSRYTLPGRQGTIVFPVHSTEHVKAVANWEPFLERLRNLPEHMKPVTVCLYWKDAGLADVFGEFRVVTAGCMFDQDFTYRLLWLCLSHKYTITNRPGAAMFVAALAECEPSIMRLDYTMVADGVEPQEYVDAQHGTKQEFDIFYRFDHDRYHLPVENSQTVNLYTGLANVMAPDELKAALL